MKNTLDKVINEASLWARTAIFYDTRKITRLNWRDEENKPIMEKKLPVFHSWLEKNNINSEAFMDSKGNIPRPCHLDQLFGVGSVWEKFDNICQNELKSEKMKNLFLYRFNKLFKIEGVKKLKEAFS